MEKREPRSSPRAVARIGGVLYLVIIVVGFLEEFFVRGGIVVRGDATATAAHLKSMESLWRWGIAGELVLGICTIALTLILYVLLRPVNKDWALLATFFGLSATAVDTSYSLQLIQALLPLDGSGYLSAFTPDQLAAMATLSIRAHAQGFGIALLLFGCFFPVAGYLIFRSGYFPKVLGVLYVIPGLSYLASSFALILTPSFADRYYFVLASPVLIGEVSLCLWLLVKGVDVGRWNVALEAQRTRIAV